MKKEKVLSILGQVLIVAAGVFTADLLKQGLAKAKLSKPMKVTPED